jgi:signal transduction histidine kinase
MGSTGESYFVAQDSLMRSASRFFSDRPPLTIKVSTEAMINAFKGITENHILTDYRGEKVVSIYRKLDIPDLKWALISEIDFNEAVKPINQLENYFIIITLIIILMILMITYFISNAISKPILYLKDIIIKLSKGIIPEGIVQGKNDDEIGQITNATKQLIEGLKRTTEFAHEIGSGNFKASFTSLSEKDTLGIALISMREKLKNLNEREVRLVREKTAALVEGQENERKRIIRELHDGVGQLLTVIKLRLQMMEGQDEIKDEIKLLINETIAEVRRISYNVMPSALVDFGLEAALRGLCENIKKHSGLSIDFTYVKEEKTPLNFEISIAVFRIIQEGLNNILKHSNATEVKIYVVENEDQIYFVLKDNGIGFHKESSEKKGGLGLSGMKERAKLLNGEVEIQSGSGNGTEIEVHIPVKRAQQ